jgi:hypothetical protein
MRPPFISHRICVDEFAVVHIALFKQHRRRYSQAPSVIHSPMRPVDVHCSQLNVPLRRLQRARPPAGTCRTNHAKSVSAAV